LNHQILTHWVTTTHFIGFLLLPRFRAYLGASTPWFGWGYPQGLEVGGFIVWPILGFSCDLLHRLQERFTGEHHLFPTLDEPPLPDNSLLIDQEEGPLGDRQLGQRGIEGQAAILPRHPQIWKVAEQRVGQLERLRKRFLRERMVGADPQNLDIERLELAVVRLPGRQVRDSGRGEIYAIELEENMLLPLELAQADLLPRGAGECEVGGFLPDLECCRYAHATQHPDEPQAQHTPPGHTLHYPCHQSPSLQDNASLAWGCIAVRSPGASGYYLMNRLA
jgi:hypothetical protein